MERRKLQWYVVLPLFATGMLATAIGVTVAASDILAFAGIVLTSMGIIAMWAIVEDHPNKLALIGAGSLFIGSLLTAVAMTMKPSNPLLFAGMIFAGFGTIAMWHADKSRPLAYIVTGSFLIGTVMEAFGLTLGASDIAVMVGMIFIGASIFGMWLYDTSEKAHLFVPKWSRLPVGSDIAGISPTDRSRVHPRSNI